MAELNRERVEVDGSARGGGGPSLRQWLPLVGMTFSAFILNTSEFMPVGLLVDIAGSFSIAEAACGLMITAYAWAVMLLSLPLMIAASRIEFKRLLLGVLSVFAVGQFLSAAAPTFPILILARIVVASSHAIFWSIAAVMATRLVDARHGSLAIGMIATGSSIAQIFGLPLGRAIAHAIFWSIAAVMATRLVDARHGSLAIGMIATGSSIAQIFGLPLGRAIGLALGWRMTFGVVGVIAAVVIAYLAATLPPMPAGAPFALARLPRLLGNRLLLAIYAFGVVGVIAAVVIAYLAATLPPMPAGAPFALARLPRLLGNRLLLAIYVATILFATGYYTCYSYIEPFLQQVAGFDAGMITASLTVFGVAGIAGSALFSRFYDGRSRPFLALVIAGVAVAIAVLRPLAGSVPAVLASFMLWGCCGTALNVAFQAEIIKCAGDDDSSVAMSIFSGLFNFGIGAGSALGGMVVASASVESIGIVGAVIVAASWVVTATVMFRLMGRRHVDRHRGRRHRRRVLGGDGDGDVPADGAPPRRRIGRAFAPVGPRRCGAAMPVRYRILLTGRDSRAPRRWARVYCRKLK